MTTDKLLANIVKRLQKIDVSGDNLFLVAREMDVHYNTLRSIRKSQNINPTLDVLRKIEAYLSAKKS